MKTTTQRTIIIGAGIAGVSAAKKLHELGYRGEVMLVSDEQVLPYDRPPLSKEILQKTVCFDDIVQLSDNDIEKMGIHFVTDRQVKAIDTQAGSLLFEQHPSVNYDHLIIATGSRARQLPCSPSIAADIYYLRTIGDSNKIAAALNECKHLLIIGGGWIGLELASSARLLGVQVTLIEAAPQLCGRSVEADIAGTLQTIHQQKGVDIQLGNSIESIKRGSDKQWQVLLQNGRQICCDMVVAGIGSIPNMELAQEAGIEVDNGIVVDKDFKTSIPNVFAAGDVTHFFHAGYGRSMRLESYTNALCQGALAAQACMGQPVAYTEIPWFWSNQYEHNIQILGQVTGDFKCVVRGDKNDKQFLTLYIKDQRIVGAIAFNKNSEIRQVKKLIMAQKPIDIKQLQDNAIALKYFL